MAASNSSELSGFEEFCGGPFWDINLTWNTDRPDFTPCFQNSVLVWVPCAFLWVVMPFYICYLSSCRGPTIPSNKVNRTKTIIPILLALVACADLIKTATEYGGDANPATVYIVSPAVWAVTFILSAILFQMERSKAFITSGIQFLFYLLTVLAGIVPFYSKIMHVTDDSATGEEEDVFFFTTFYIHYFLLLVMLVMTCITDTLPYEPIALAGKEPCPEVKASFLSRITFWWLNGLVLMGYRKSLEADDLWALNPRDVTSNTGPIFEKAWEKELTRVNWRNGKQKKQAVLARGTSYMGGDQTYVHGAGGRAKSESSEKTPLLAAEFRQPSTSPEVEVKEKKKEPSLFKVLAGCYGWTLLTAHLCKLVCDILTFIGPTLQRLLIGFTEDPEMQMWKGFLYAALFMVTSVVNSFFFHQLFHIGMTLGMRIKAAVIAAVYKKALTMSNEARKTATVGEIVNLMSVDAQRLQDVTGYLWMVWSAPLQIAIAIYLLWGIIGPSVLAGLGVMILLIPVNGVLASFQRKLQIAQMSQKDQRIKIMNEVLNGMKVLKLYAWELSFKEKVNAIRTKELDTLKKYSYLGAVGTFTWTCAPFLVTLATFAAYTLSGGILDAEKAFVCLSLFNILRFPLSILPMMISYLVTVTLMTFTAYVLSGGVLDAEKAFVCLSLFNILRFPMNLLPMLVTYLITVTLATFATYVLSGGVLDAEKAFVSLSLFNILRFPITLLPMMISYLVTITFATITTFVLNGGELTASVAFPTLSLFNVLRAPMSLMPNLVALVVTVTLATFATFVLTGGQLDATIAFTSLSLFNILRAPMIMLPNLLSFFITASVSIKRLGKFLMNGDIDDDNVSHDPRAEHPIMITNGTFSWGTEKDDLPILKNVTVKIAENSLTAVVGQVGSGKSSMLSAFLGEMERLKGRVNVRGSVAYVAQQAWIQNASLRDNILFGKPFDDDKYQKVLEACALKPDLEILPGGDLTEIGEKGINLSGGQKQRVSLARAVYQDCDLYLLDDPLSAVDSHVGKHIFEQVICDKGLLANKTRVLVTHGVQWLPKTDSIIVLVQGEVTEMGSFEELVSRGQAFAQFLKTYLTQQDSESEEEDPEVQKLKTEILQRVESIAPSEEGAAGGKSGSEKDSNVSGTGSRRRRKQSASRHSTTKSPHTKRSMSRKVEEDEKKEKDKEKEKLIEAEKSEVGQVKWAVFISYCRALGLVYALLLLLFFLLYQGGSVASNIWLSLWTENDILKNSSIVNTSYYINERDLYLGVYGGLGGVQALFVLVYAIVAAISMVNASGKLHELMLHNILRSPMSFFDTTPIGRILNRFSRDIETIDNILPNLIRSWMNTFFTVVSTIIVISYSTPIFLSVVVPLGILYYFIQRFYIPTSRQLKRVESTTRSPIYVHFSETVTGASTIRAYQVQNRFIDLSADKVDHNLVFYFASIASNRWLGFRLEFVGALVVFSAAMFAVLGRTGGISGGLVGLSISYALQVTSSLNWMVRMTTDLETNIVSVERVKEYSETPTEGDWEIEETRPPPQWPDEGAVEFEDYSTRYREGLDLVVRGITLNVKGGEKVGIVGRTGAGKSSMTLSLFRIIEAAGGSIIIDGIPISTLGLHQLRSKLTILPQDPVLFSGSLRMNLDPFDMYSDQLIWNALEHAHLKEFVTSLPAGLTYECGEGGQNLSVGQRQLVCLARSLLRKTKILILDEATAAVDLETDELIQKTIRKEFAECTILTIAHRLNTIMDSDRVLVLDQGKIKECDSPGNLLTNKDSAFYAMCKDAGLAS